MNCFQQLLKLHEVCRFQSNEGEKVGAASNSEIRRWFKQGCIEVNFEPAQADDEWPAFLKSLVLFPKNKKKRCTLYFDEAPLIRVM